MTQLFALGAEIRIFGTPEEIKSVVPIENNPVTKQNYKKIIGDYNLPSKLKCCFSEKEGRLCEQEHSKGWVIELQDGSTSIIGNVCAERQFEADSRLIADRSKYINEKRRQERLASLSNFIQEKPARLASLTELKHKIEGLHATVNRFLDDLGPMVRRKLKDMHRTGRYDVVINVVRLHEYVENDQTKVERRRFPQVLGRINAVELSSPGTFIDIYEGINEIVRAYDQAQKLDGVPKSKVVDSLVARLNDYERLQKEGDRILELERTFFNNDWLPLSFLVDDKTERYKAAKLAMRASGISGNKEDAKNWLAVEEKRIKNVLKADQLETL